MKVQNLLNEINFTAVRSRGPGGQNVNKVSSASLLTWDFWSSQKLSEEQKLLIATKLVNIINKDDILYIRSDEYRDLERNKSRCLEKLDHYLTRALTKPKPRKKTKPSRASKIKRLDSKKRHGETKKMRRKIDY